MLLCALSVVLENTLVPHLRCADSRSCVSDDHWMRAISGGRPLVGRRHSWASNHAHMHMVLMIRVRGVRDARKPLLRSDADTRNAGRAARRPAGRLD